MLNMKILFQSVVLAIALGILFATVTFFWFPGWYQENTMLAAIIMGGLCGPIYPLLMRKKNK